MKMVTYIAVFLGGIVVCFLLVSLGVIDAFDGLPGRQEEPGVSLPTYLSFVSVMLTAVTVVLAALAIGIGIIAAYTFKEIRGDAQKAVMAKIDEYLSDSAINERIDRVAFANRKLPTVAELEEILTLAMTKIDKEYSNVYRN